MARRNNNNRRRGRGMTGTPGQPNLNTAEGVINYAQQNAQFNQVNPYGSQTWSTDPRTGQRTLTTSLDPSQQGLLNAQTAADQQSLGLMGSLAGQQAAKGQLSYDDIARVPGEADLLGQRARVEDQLFQRFQRQLSPIFQQQQQELAQRLVEQGIPVGSERYNREMSRFSTDQNNAYLDAAAQASAQGLNEFQTLSDTARANRQNAVEERNYQFNLPLNQMTALSGTIRGVQNPNFIPYQAPDVGGIATSFAQGQADRDAQMEIARMNNATARATGGGGGGIDPMARMQMENDEWTRRNSIMHQQAMELRNQNKGSGSSPLWNLAGSFGSAFLQGAGGSAFGQGGWLRNSPAPATGKAGGLSAGLNRGVGFGGQRKGGLGRI